MVFGKNISKKNEMKLVLLLLPFSASILSLKNQKKKAWLLDQDFILLINDYFGNYNLKKGQSSPPSPSPGILSFKRYRKAIKICVTLNL